VAKKRSVLQGNTGTTSVEFALLLSLILLICLVAMEGMGDGVVRLLTGTAEAF
jgi:Flp pilus assembly pilin Flp